MRFGLLAVAGLLVLASACGAGLDADGEGHASPLAASSETTVPSFRVGLGILDRERTPDYLVHLTVQCEGRELTVFAPESASVGTGGAIYSQAIPKCVEGDSVSIGVQAGSLNAGGGGFTSALDDTAQTRAGMWFLEFGADAAGTAVGEGGSLAWTWVPDADRALRLAGYRDVQEVASTLGSGSAQ